MFADRERLRFDGLVFELDNGTIDTRPILPLDRPLQVLSDAAPVDTPPNNPVRFFEVVEALSKRVPRLKGAQKRNQWPKPMNIM